MKSISGLKWALPFFFADVHAKLYNGSFLLVQLMGADSSTLLGVPPQLLKGKLEDLRNARAVIVDQSGINKLSQNLKKPLDVGDLFDINDHEVKIVGIVKAEKSFYGHPYIYTTFGRAVDIAPKTRRTLSFILVQPNKGVDINQLAERITKETGLHAFTSDTFFWSTIWWFFLSWQIPLIALVLLLFIIIVSALVGIQKINKLDVAEVFRA